MNTETKTTETKTNEHHVPTNGRTGNGKIARLPRHIRETLNRRLADNESGETLLAWLNGLPEVQTVLARDFEGKPITKQNLSEWRTRSFQRWQARQELLEEAEDLAAVADETAVISRDDLLGNLSTVLAVRYAGILMELDKPVTEDFESRFRMLHRMCQDITALRRGELADARRRFAAKSEPSEPAPKRHAGCAPATEAMAAGGKEARSPQAEVRTAAPVQVSAPAVKPSPTQSNQSQLAQMMPVLDLHLADEFGLPAKPAALYLQKPNWPAPSQPGKGSKKAAL